jgi:DNA-binding HxlR family transcriptional regulator
MAMKRDERAEGPGCPTRRIMEVIGAKWTLAILPLLREREMRHHELRDAMGGISQKVLTETLRHLERRGLVEREERAGFPRVVTYRLTGLGRSLAEAFGELNRWVERHGEEIRWG